MKKNERESNFELLRIFAVVLIIFHHICIHIIAKQIPSVEYNPDGLFNNFSFYNRLFITDFGLQIGRVANALFILISGYFLCSKDNTNVFKQAKKLLSQILYVTLLIMSLSLIYQLTIDKSFTYIETFKSFSDQWWFVGYYFIIILFGSLFINKKINRLSREKYRTILICLFAIITFQYTRNLLSDISERIPTILNGIFLYIFGGYIKKYNPFHKLKNWHIIFFILIISGIMYFSYYNFITGNINQAILDNNDNFTQTFMAYFEYEPHLVVLAILIFELFRRIKIKNNLLINYIASSAFMVYIIHNNTFMKQLYLKIDFITPYYYNLPKFIIMIVVFILVIFIIGVLCFSLYRLIANFVNKFLNKYLNT